MKRWLIDTLFVFLIVAVITFMVITILFFTGNGKKCLSNPISYFEEKNDGAICTCVKDGVTWPNTVERKAVNDEKIEFNETEYIEGILDRFSS